MNILNKALNKNIFAKNYFFISTKMLSPVKLTCSKYDTIDEEHRIVHLKIFNNRDIEIMYNHRRNTFNANHLLKQFNVNEERIKQWKRNIDTIKLIDEISQYLHGTPHFSYKGACIWKDDGNIIPSLLSNRGNILKSSLEENEDNICYFISSGNSNPLKGTWYTYEMFPEILRLISIEFRILANHYESLLLPLLTDKDETFENHVNWLNKQSLIKDEVINKLKYIPEPFIKGNETEKYIMDLLGEVFTNVKHVGTKKHSCDIYLKDDNIYVEVKCRKDKVAKDYEKFRRDLIERNATLGLYVNILYDEPTRIEFNPLCFYINVNDFSKDMLLMIKRTAENVNRIHDSSLDANKYLETMIVNKNITEKAMERLEVSLENIINMTCARLKNKYKFGELIQYKDKTDTEENSTADKLAKLNEKYSNDTIVATKSYFMINIKKLMEGTHTTPFIKNYIKFMKNNDVVPLSEPEFRDFVNAYCRKNKRLHMTINGKDSSVEGFILLINPNFEIDEKYKYAIDDNNGIDEEDEANKNIPSEEEILNEYVNFPDVKEKLTIGYNTDSFKNSLDYYTNNKYKIKISNYKMHLLNHCIQAYSGGKKTKFILKDTELANEILDDACEFINTIDIRELKNKNSILKKYDEWTKNKPKLTKDVLFKLVDEN